MSALREQALQSRLREAMKARESTEVAVLRALIAATKNARIEKRISGDAELPESDLLQIVRREIKQREETISFAERAQRTDLIAKNRAECEILQRLLPQAPSREEIEASVKRHYEAGATNIGAIMGRLKEEFGSRLEGRTASEVARRFLETRGGA